MATVDDLVNGDDAYDALPKPSDEQRLVIDDFRKGRNIKIAAVAGAGKSTMLMQLAKLVPHKQTLILTYNKPLQREVDQRLKEAGLIHHTRVRTYHSACGLAYGRLVRTDYDFIDALRTGDPPAETLQRQLPFDILMMDEVQDMSIAYYVFVSRLIRFRQGAQVVIVGDRRQAINDFRGARVEFLDCCDSLPGFQNGQPWSEHALRTSYRLTPGMANFVNEHILGGHGCIIGGNMNPTARQDKRRQLPSESKLLTTTTTTLYDRDDLDDIPTPYHHAKGRVSVIPSSSSSTATTTASLSSLVSSSLPAASSSSSSSVSLGSTQAVPTPSIPKEKNQPPTGEKVKSDVDTKGVKMDYKSFLNKWLYPGGGGAHTSSSSSTKRKLDHDDAPDTGFSKKKAATTSRPVTNKACIPQGQEDEHDTEFQADKESPTTKMDVLYLALPFNEIAAEINYQVRKAAHDFGGYDKIAIIAPSISVIQRADSIHPLATLVREYLTDIPLYIAKHDDEDDSNKVADEVMLKGKLLICTWNSMKGMERDCVFTYGLDESYPTYYHKQWHDLSSVPDVMYMSVTRARRRAVMIADHKNTLRTCNLSRLPKDVHLITQRTPPTLLHSFTKNVATSGHIVTEGGGWRSTKPKTKSAPKKKTKQRKPRPIVLKKPETLLAAADKAPPQGADGKASSSSSSTTKKRKPTFTASNHVPLGELIRHLDPSTTCLMMECMEMVSERQVRAPPPISPNFFIVHFPEKGTSENVAYLYGLVIRALSEVSLTHSKTTHFAKDVHLPKIVEDLEEGQQQLQQRGTKSSSSSSNDPSTSDTDRYSLSRAAYESYPSGFWEDVKSAYETPVLQRKWDEWFRLALAVDAFHNNAHHMARQITHYRWVNEAFIQQARECMVEAMSSVASGAFPSQFEVPITARIYAGPIKGMINVLGYLDFVDKVRGQVWMLRCVSESATHHLLQLALQLCFTPYETGNLYLVSTGKITQIRVSPENKTKLIRLATSKFDKPASSGNILQDIEEWMRKHRIPP